MTTKIFKMVKFQTGKIQVRWTAGQADRITKAYTATAMPQSNNKSHHSILKTE